MTTVKEILDGLTRNRQWIQELNEADAWEEAFPHYNVSTVSAGDESGRRDVRAWRQQIDHGHAIRITTPYFPSESAGVQ